MSTQADKLDAIDMHILQLLQEDGRITNLELSSRIGLSPASTLERVKKLEKAKIIESYHARLNRQKLNLGISALMMITLSRQFGDSMSRFKEKIKKIPEIVECYQITGNADYMLKVTVKDMPAFEKLIANTFSQIEEIGHLQTMIVVSDVKQSKLLPLNYSR